MDCDRKDVKNICSIYMKRFDNYLQAATDKGRGDLIPYFSEAYDLLEKYFRNLTKEMLLTTEARNEIRGTIKFTEKLAGSELYI